MNEAVRRCRERRKEKLARRLKARQLMRLAARAYARRPLPTVTWISPK